MARTFDLFSAQPKGLARLEPPSTTRWPSNVPTLVDNLWEWHRFRCHSSYPRRRHAVYAWPRKEMAEQYAKVESAKGRELTVCRVVFDGGFKLCQVRVLKDSKVCGVPDSRDHPDCHNLRKDALNFLAEQGLVKDKGWTAAATLKVKEDIGRLWIPGLTPEEVQAMSEYSEAVRNLLKAVEGKITYWKHFLVLDESRPGSVDCSMFDDGEIFFETDGAELRPA